MSTMPIPRLLSVVASLGFLGGCQPTVEELRRREDVTALSLRLESSHPTVRVDAARALSDLAHRGIDRRRLEPALVALASAVNGDNDTFVQGNFEDALVAVAEHVGIEPLVVALRDESQVKASDAADALGVIARKVDDTSLLKGAVLPLSEAIVHGEGKLVSDWASIALLQVVSHVEDRSILQGAQEVLTKGLQADEWWGPLNAAIALAVVAEKLGDEATLDLALTVLIDALHDDRWAVRWASASGLRRVAERLEDKSRLNIALHSLAKALGDENASVRRIAARVLEAIGTGESQAAVEAHRRTTP